MGLGGETKGKRGAVTFLVLGEAKQFQPGRGGAAEKERKWGTAWRPVSKRGGSGCG